MTASDGPNSDGVRAIYEDVSDEFPVAGRIRDPDNENAWIQSTLTVTLGPDDTG